MDVQLDFPPVPDQVQAKGTLTTEHQALVRVLNLFLSLHPENGDKQAALRLEEIAQAAGYGQARSLRAYKQRFEEQGMGSFLDKHSPGRPPVTTCPEVEGAVVQAILDAVISEQRLPDDEALARTVNQRLEQASMMNHPPQKMSSWDEPAGEVLSSWPFSWLRRAAAICPAMHCSQAALVL